MINNKNVSFIIVILAIVNYGNVLDRGGYADDFVFISYSQNKDLLNAILDWPFNGRLSQSVLIPTLFKLSMGDELGQFNWLIIQGIGLACLIIILFLFDKIMSLVDIPNPARICACLFFCLYPIKNSTIFWPATIIGYVIAVTLFLYAVSVYYSNAKKRTDSFVSFLFVFILFTIANLSIEQIVPLIIITIFFRLVIWKTDLKSKLLHLLLGMTQALIFLSVNLFLDESTEKMERHLLDSGSLIKNVINVSAQSIFNFLKQPIIYILDRYYWSELIESALQIEFFISIILIGGILYHINKSVLEESNQNNKTLTLFFLGGVICWFAGISPLMLINYYLPDRIFFIPLFGASVSFGIAFYCLIRKLPILKNVALGTLMLSGMLLSLINLYTQNNYSNRWQNEKQVIEKLVGLKGEIQGGMTINLFNFPSDFGPSPGIEDHFTFNGIVNWLYPQKDLKGSTLSDFSEIMQLPSDFDNANSFPISYSPKENNLLLIYNQKNNDISLLKSLTISSGGLSSAANSDSGNDITAALTKLNDLHQTRNFSVETPYLLTLPQYDISVLPISLTNVNSASKIRINLHASLKDGTMIPLDKWVYRSNKDDMIYKTTFFLNESSRIESVSLIHGDQKVLLTRF